MRGGDPRGAAHPCKNLPQASSGEAGARWCPGEASQIIWPFGGNDGERRRPSLHSGRLFDYGDKPTCNHHGTAAAISIAIPSFLKSRDETPWFSYTRDHDVRGVDHFRSQITKEYQNDKLEFIKNPVVAEFLGISADSNYRESDFETAIID